MVKRPPKKRPPKRERPPKKRPEKEVVAPEPEPEAEPVRRRPRWIFDRDGKIDPEWEAIADCILGKSDKFGVIVKFRGHSKTEKLVGKHCKNLFCLNLQILTKDWIETGEAFEKIYALGITSKEYFVSEKWDGESTQIRANGLFYDEKMKDWRCGECWMGDSGISYDVDSRGETIIGIPSFNLHLDPAHRSWQIEEQERLLSGFVPSESPFPTCNKCEDSDDVTDSGDDDDYYWCSHCEHDIDWEGDCVTSDCGTCDDDDDIDEDTGIQYKFRWDDK